MYRARAESVAGTRVYADGKWLQCIGNKNVSVGEYIWTDGRCVYGHFQESQQPPVITLSQEDEGIPIIASNLSERILYTFKENKLKRVATLIKENGKYNLYNNIGDKLSLVGEMPNTDEKTYYTLMINDFKKTAFLYDERTSTDVQLIASNIDKAGNHFDMVVRNYKSGEEVQRRVEILRNGEVVNSVELQPLIDKTLADCPDTQARWYIKKWYVPPSVAYPGVSAERLANLPNAYSTLEAGRLGFSNETLPRAFIEDEQTWYFFVFAYSSKQTLYDDVLGTRGDEVEVGGYTGCIERTGLQRLYFVSANGETIIYDSCITRYFMGIDSKTFLENFSWEHNTKTAERITIALQDGYHYEAQDFFGWDEILETTSVESHDLKNFAVMTFYTPNHIELFRGVFPLYGRFLICKVTGGHLLYVSFSVKSILPEDINFDTYKGAPVMDAGLYFIKGGKCQATSPKIFEIINERLRPMKKIENWQKRLQSIEIEQEEI